MAATDSRNTVAGRARRLPLATRAAGITGSVIDSSTSLLQSQSHDIVRFAMGSPAPEAIPSEQLAEIAAQVMSCPGTCDYGPTEGEPELRLSLLEFLGRRHRRAPEPAELLITSGGMQGLDLACKLFVDPGDLVAVESPTYTNGTAVITSYGGELLEVPVDDEGLDVDALCELAAGRPPKLIYVIPNFQNPSGVTLSLRRRTLLVQAAARWGAVILEDDPYEELRFGGDGLPGLRELAPPEVLVIGVHTFSKILAPGLRVGWVDADPDVIERMIDAKQGLDTCANVPMQRVVAGFIGRGLMEDHVRRLREHYRTSKLAIQDALALNFDQTDVSWTDPGGGFFLWLTLPAQVDTEELFALALQHGVAFIPGPAFTSGQRFGNALRLSFASTSGARTHEGIARLRTAVDRYLAGERAGEPPREATAGAEPRRG